MNILRFVKPWNSTRSTPGQASGTAFASGLLATATVVALASVASGQPPWSDEFDDYHRAPPELRRYDSATLYRSVPVAGGDTWVEFEPPWDENWEEGVGDPDWDYEWGPTEYRREDWNTRPTRRPRWYRRDADGDWDIQQRWRYGQSQRVPRRPAAPGPDEWYDPYLDDDYFLDDHADEGADEPDDDDQRVRVGDYPPYNLNRDDPRYYAREYSDDYFSRQYFFGVERSRPEHEDTRTAGEWRDNFNVEDEDDLEFWWEED